MKLYLETKVLVLDLTPGDAVVRTGKYEWYFTNPKRDCNGRSVWEMLKPQVLSDELLSHNN